MIRLSFFQASFTRGPLAKAVLPIFSTACGAYSILGTICAVVFQSPAGFSQDSEAEESNFWLGSFSGHG